MPEEENKREIPASAAQLLLGPSISCSSGPIVQRINSLRTSEVHDAKAKRPLPNPSVSASPQLHTSTRNKNTQAHALKRKRHTNPQAYQTRPQKLDAQIKQELNQTMSEIMIKMTLLPPCESRNALQKHQIIILSAQLQNVQQDIRALEPATPNSTIIVVPKKKATILLHMKGRGPHIKSSLIISFPFAAIASPQLESIKKYQNCDH